MMSVMFHYIKHNCKGREESGVMVTVTKRNKRQEVLAEEIIVKVETVTITWC